MIIFLILLNGFATIVSGISVAEKVYAKDFGSAFWWYLILGILNLICFIINTFRLRRREHGGY